MSNVPEYDKVILDTREIVSDLIDKLESLSYACITINEVMELVFTSIMYENRAKEELAQTCIKLLKDSLGSGSVVSDVNNADSSILVSQYNDDITRMTNIVYMLGEKIASDLVNLRAYRNGYLFYQFLKMIDKDIMLEKFVPPTIPESVPD